MRAQLALVLVAASCKTSSKPAAQGPAIDWNACDTALAKVGASANPDGARIVIDGCHVCGDWDPILRWNTPQTSGGPTQAAIETAMARCNAFCTGDAKLKFLGTLDDARGTSSRTPWRQLGEICKEKVSAGPDGRFMSAPYFALDRIARAAFAHGGETAKLAESIRLALPPVTAVGTSIAVPEAKLGVTLGAPGHEIEMPQARPASNVITFIAGDIYFDETPIATMSGNGLALSPGATSYPGRKVALAELPAVLGEAYRGRARHAGPAADGDHLDFVAPTILLVSPPATSASGLVPIIAAADPIAEVHLAATMPGADESWAPLRGMAISLDAMDPTMKLGPDTTVQQLATILARQAASGAKRVGVTAQ